MPAADLRDDMGGRAEAVDADRARVARPTRERQPIRPAQISGAAATGSRTAVEPKGIGGVGDNMGGEAAVARVAGEERLIDRFSRPREAIGAAPAGVAEPGDADPLADPRSRTPSPSASTMPRSRVPERSGSLGRQVAVDDVQVGPANRAGLDPHPDLARARRRIGACFPNEGHPQVPQHHRVHGSASGHKLRSPYTTRSHAP